MLGVSLNHRGRCCEPTREWMLVEDRDGSLHEELMFWQMELSERRQDVSFYVMQDLG